MNDFDGGARYQIIVLKIKRNQDEAVKELIALKKHMYSKKERYEVIAFEYGRLTKALIKLQKFLLSSNLIVERKKYFFNTVSMFIDEKVVASNELDLFGLKYDFMKIKENFFGKKE
jgi:hypothetical protein